LLPADRITRQTRIDLESTGAQDKPPLVVVEKRQGAMRLVALSRQAKRAGLATGISLADARALVARERALMKRSLIPQGLHVLGAAAGVDLRRQAIATGQHPHLGGIRQPDAEGVVGFDKDFHLPAVFLFLFLPPVEKFDGLAVIFVGQWGTPSAASEDAKVGGTDLFGELGKGEKSGAAGFGVTDQFEGSAENTGGVACERLADGGEATGLFRKIGGKVDAVFERAEFEAVD
jgi:hypothetical protein